MSTTVVASTEVAKEALGVGVLVVPITCKPISTDGPEVQVNWISTCPLSLILTPVTLAYPPFGFI